jgi:hypothetical protein
MAFEPTMRQRGARLRGHKVYCTRQCRLFGSAAIMRRWWRSPKGRRYARERRAKITH